METTARVREILSWYPSDNPGTLTNLYRLLMHGRLGGTGVPLLEADGPEDGGGPGQNTHSTPSIPSFGVWKSFTGSPSTG